MIINLYGGPGLGKSTTAAGVFSLLKLHGVNAELVTEFAKDLTWEERHKTLTNQYYIWGKQYHKMWRLRDEVDVIVTDSPLLLSLLYGKTCASFHETVIKTFNDTFNNMNYVLKRVKDYNPKGRNQTEQDARCIDAQVEQMLLREQIPYKTMPGSHYGINGIMIDVLKKLNIKWRYRVKDRQDT